MSSLADAGLTGFASLPPELTLAQWLAQGGATGAMRAAPVGATPEQSAQSARSEYPAQSEHPAQSVPVATVGRAAAQPGRAPAVPASMSAAAAPHNMGVDPTACTQSTADDASASSAMHALDADPVHGATPQPGLPGADPPCRPGAAPWAAIHAAEVLLGDGGEHWLGPFGAQGGQPLHHPQLRELVSALFALANSTEAKQCLALPAWPGRYRLDALVPPPPTQPNLARLLAGHGTSLAWVQALILCDPAPVAPATPAPDVDAPGLGAPGVDAPGTDASAVGAPGDAAGLAAARLDARIKALFDPWDRFPA